ncbi:DUF427 domain-containing protein [Methylobacterium oryzihabitans]|uniref:DUF427 domain-containing protein n=1 Tax=Methylobacterium oryzihabitans TaxID=2499852 RepID=A0A3S2VB75_9HYPH|nr:DUF427 domain-containing protein [Methylobacterium oryzihabitans]RVU20299.1 DUF427 domain-containing protein [Methylobacterium oryzihabitans]
MSDDHPITVTPNPHRIRVVLGGVIVAETTRALTLREAGLPPVQYIPREDAEWDLFAPSTRRTRCPHKGEASYYGLTAGGVERADAVWSYEDPLPQVAAIRGHLAFYPNKVDAIEEFKD